ncbi:MAG TPA: hypothetical protein VIQ29_12425 [Ancylobacter sp.]
MEGSFAPMSLKKSALERGDITARIGRATPQHVMACDPFGSSLACFSLASFLRFRALARRVEFVAGALVDSPQAS